MRTMNKAWTGPLLAAVLAGALAPAQAAYVSERDGYRLAMRVVPRIGGFNNSVYEEARDASCNHKSARTPGRMNWSEYKAQLGYRGPEQFVKTLAGDEDIRAAFPTFPEWDIVTVASENQAHEGCAYGARRLLVTVTPIDASQAPRCAFKLGGLAAASGAGPGACKLDIVLPANGEVPLEVSIASAAHPAPVVLLDAVPEDLLIVSMGDSYSSGEGNPDIPRQGSNAQWMDESCHRSIYAGPFRAAMRILREGQSLGNARYRKAAQAGAMTVVSFACSGGWVSRGLDGGYEGVKPLKEFVIAKDEDGGARGSSGGQGELALGVEPLLPPQTEQLKKFLETQLAGTSARKSSIDMLVLGGGGNDVGFAPLIIKLVKDDITESTAQPLNRTLDISFNRLSDAYNKFGPKLQANRFDAGARQYEVLNVVPVLYPDLLRQVPEKDCTGALDQESTSLEGILINVFGRWLNKNISAEESQYVRENVLKRLNRTIVDISRRMGWRPLDPTPVGTVMPEWLGNAEDDLRKHGWCRSATNVHPYDDQQRWFRQPSESHKYQNNLNGSFHPTWQFNDKVTGAMLANAFRQAVEAEPKWDTIRPLRTATVGDVRYLPAEAQFSYPAPDGGPLPELSATSPTSGTCKASATGCKDSGGLKLGAHGSEVDVVAWALHPSYLRRYPQRAFGHFRVDEQAPDISADSGPDLLSGTSHWLAARTLSLTSSDTDSGVATFNVVVSDATAPVPQPVTRLSQHAVKSQVLFPSDGRFALTVCARDGVGNASAACGKTIELKVDTVPLKPAAVGAYGVQWWTAADAGREPVIPVFPSIAPDAQVTFTPGDASGLAAGADCAVPGNDACALQLPGATAWQRVRRTAAYRDTAGNLTTFVYWTVQAMPFSQQRPPRTAGSWTAQANRVELTHALRAALEVAPSVGKLLPDTPETKARLDILMARRSPADQQAAARLFADASDRALVTEWLNILSGRRFAFAPGAAPLQVDCAGTASVAATPLSDLHVRTSCAAAGTDSIAVR